MYRMRLLCGDTDKRSREILLLTTDMDKISEGTSLSISDFAEKIEDE